MYALVKSVVTTLFRWCHSMHALVKSVVTALFRRAVVRNSFKV